MAFLNKYERNLLRNSFISRQNKQLRITLKSDYFQFSKAKVAEVVYGFDSDIESNSSFLVKKLSSHECAKAEPLAAIAYIVQIVESIEISL